MQCNHKSVPFSLTALGVLMSVSRLAVHLSHLSIVFLTEYDILRLMGMEKLFNREHG